MPIYVVKCRECGSFDERLLPGPEALAGLRCRVVAAEGGTECGGEVERSARAPTLHNKEVVDLPHMVKPVERFSDAERLYEERSKKDYRKPE